MIFVTVGTVYGFDRLVKIVDRAVAEGVLKDEVFAQIGTGSFKPQHCSFTTAMEKGEFDRRMDEASCIISHAGMGVLTGALDRGKPVLAMPRVKQHGEAVNDHQLDIAEAYARLGHILVARNEQEFMAVAPRLSTFRPLPRVVDTEAVIARVSSYLQNLAERI